ncbi:hypothetical protein J6590_047193 [Homalodisca vitripennis]|nr:hypothetical protein J6590_047193 [Homalodisca vitripennis]
MSGMPHQRMMRNLSTFVDVIFLGFLQTDMVCRFKKSNNTKQNNNNQQHQQNNNNQQNQQTTTTNNTTKQQQPTISSDRHGLQIQEVKSMTVLDFRRCIN